MNLASLLPLLITASVVLVVLGLGLQASWLDVSHLFRRPDLLARSLLSMTVVMPLVAVMLVVVFNLPTAVQIALVALAISPVPPLLPKKEVNAGGNAPYAIGLFAATALLAIITVPLSVALFNSAFDRTGAISPLKIAGVVLSTVLLPLAVGVVLRGAFPASAQRVARPIAIVGICLLVLSAVPLMYVTWSAVHALFGNGTVLIIAAMALMGLGVGHVLGGPSADHRTVLALSTASRHPAVALTVAVAGGAQSKPALAAILLYTIVAAIASLPYIVWRKRQSSGSNLLATSTTETVN